MKCIEVRPDGSKRVYTINNEESRTQQQFKDDVDVNNIIAKYKKTGQIMHLNRKAGVYADLSNITDYATMVNQTFEAQKAFMTLPAEIRRRFDNDPGKLVAFLQDPKNLEEGIKLGLYEKPKASQAQANNDDLNDDKRQAKTRRAVKETQLDLGDSKNREEASEAR